MNASLLWRWENVSARTPLPRIRVAGSLTYSCPFLDILKLYLRMMFFSSFNSNLNLALLSISEGIKFSVLFNVIGFSIY